MLPHVDDFRTVHNLAAIADICRALASDAPATAAAWGRGFAGGGNLRLLKAFDVVSGAGAHGFAELSRFGRQKSVRRD